MFYYHIEPLRSLCFLFNSYHNPIPIKTIWRVCSEVSHSTIIISHSSSYLGTPCPSCCWQKFDILEAFPCDSEPEWCYSENNMAVLDFPHCEPHHIWEIHIRLYPFAFISLEVGTQPYGKSWVFLKVAITQICDNHFLRTPISVTVAWPQWLK